jgi:hypothetical protein
MIEGKNKGVEYMRMKGDNGTKGIKRLREHF